MALLSGRRAALPLGAMALLASCDGTAEEARVELERFDTAVVCEDGAECRDGAGSDVTPVPLEGWALLSTETSRHAPNGLYLYAELPVDERASATLEIDLPLAGASDELFGQVAYVEVMDGARVFEATTARGVVVAPAEPHADECGCLDAAFDVELVDVGEDGELGTEDDRVRRLRRGRYGWSDERCGEAPARGQLPAERVVVERQDRCALVPRRTVVGPTYEPRVSPRPDTDDDDYSGGCGSCPASSDGCGSGDACSSSSSGGGCGGGSSSGGGCGGDSSAGSGACSGDSSAGAASCAGDAAAGAGSCAGDSGSCDCDATRSRRRIPLHGGAQTMILVGLALLVSRRW